jgi:hypothetical protein
MAAQVATIDPITAHGDLALDPGAILVCAYDDLKKFEHNQLQGAISLSAFRAQLGSIGKNHEIIFYCA